MARPRLFTWTARCALRISFPSQFTYINLAFSPAPDDTIANLYRVSPVAFSSRRVETNNALTVVRDGWTPHSKL